MIFPTTRVRVAGAYRTVNYGVCPLGAVVGASGAGLPLLRRAVLSLHSAAPPEPVTRAMPSG